MDRFVAPYWLVLWPNFHFQISSLTHIVEGKENCSLFLVRTPTHHKISNFWPFSLYRRAPRLRCLDFAQRTRMSLGDPLMPRNPKPDPAAVQWPIEQQALRSTPS